MKKIGLVAIALFLVIITWGGLFSERASSQQVESRLNNLEADFNRFESRLNQLESQLSQIRQLPSPRVPATPPQSPRNPRRNLSQQERDRMFDRLATFVIEIRDDIKKLQARVSKLESR